MKKLILILVVTLMAALLAAGCGSSGPSVEGVYKLEAGGSNIATLTLKAEGKATYSLTDDGGGLPVTYKVDGEKVVLIGADGKEIQAARYEIEDKGLRDGTGNLWKKQ